MDQQQGGFTGHVFRRAVEKVVGLWSGWHDWTPVVNQSSDLTTSNVHARYERRGQTITLFLVATITSAGSTGFRIAVSGLPVAPAMAYAHATLGAGSYHDASAAAESIPLAVIWSSAGTLTFKGSAAGSNDWYLGDGASGIAAANGDVLSFTATYEIA